MNKQQLIALWIGIGAIVALCLFPPWVSVWGRAGMRQEKYVAHSLFVTSPDHGSDIDYKRLSLECFIATVVTAGAICTLGAKAK